MADPTHCGLFNSAEESHSLMLEAVFNCRASLVRASRSLPCGSFSAAALAADASSCQSCSTLVFLPMIPTLARVKTQRFQNDEMGSRFQSRKGELINCCKVLRLPASTSADISGVYRSEFLPAFARDDNGIERSDLRVFDVVSKYLSGRSKRGRSGFFKPRQLLAFIVPCKDLVCVAKIEKESWHRYNPPRRPKNTMSVRSARQSVFS